MAHPLRQKRSIHSLIGRLPLQSRIPRTARSYTNDAIPVILMNEALEFLSEGDRFLTWLESDKTTADDLEWYAKTGTIPEKTLQFDYFGPRKTVKTESTKQKRDFNQPPSGDFMEDSVWFHPSTQERYVYKSGVWVCNPDPLSTEHVRNAAKRSGVRTYYNSLTRQFVFSYGEKSLAVDRDFFRQLRTTEDLNKYFEGMIVSK